MDIDKLGRALKDGNLPEIETFFMRGGDVNTKFGQGDTLLHRAAQYGLESITRLLCSKNASINLKNQVGWTPLMKAASFNRPEIVKILLEYGANKGEVDNGNQTALQLAQSKNNSVCADLLLNASLSTGPGGGGLMKTGSNSNLSSGISYIPIATASEIDAPRLFHEAFSTRKSICKVPMNMISNWISRDSGPVIRGDSKPSHCFLGTISYPNSPTYSNSQSAGRSVAIKLYDSFSFCSSVKLNVERVEEEVNSIAALGKSNYFVRMIGYSISNALDSVALVYEFSSRGSLGSILKKYKESQKPEEFTWETRLKIAHEISSALQFLHIYREKNPLIYRNFTSDKVVIGHDFQPKLICCGLFSENRGFSKAGGVLTGSNNGGGGGVQSYYQCPLAYINIYDVKSDVFSFGIVLLELWSGRYQAEEKYSFASIVDIAMQVDPTQEKLMPGPLELRLRNLARECVADAKARIADMSTVCRRIGVMKTMYCDSSPALPVVEKFKCKLCDKEKLSSDSIVCESKIHEVCRDCFSDQVIRQIKNGDFMEKNKMQVVCDLCPEHPPFPESVVSAKCSSAAMACYINAIKKEHVEKFTCRVCLDEWPESAAVTCQRACPYVCTECFSRETVMQIEEGVFTKNGRQIVCSVCNIKKPRDFSPYPETLIASRCTSDALSAYIKAREDAVESETQSKGEASLKQLELKAQEDLYKQRMQLETDITKRLEATVKLHTFKIMDDIIVTKCPHCQLAFADWDHCFAVEHVVQGMQNGKKKTFGCKKFFCGWCLAPFGDTDTCHRHVANCRHSLNKGSVFGRNEGDFKIVEAEMRRKKVEEYLALQAQSLSSKEIEAVRNHIKPMLLGIGVNV